MKLNQRNQLRQQKKISSQLARYRQKCLAASRAKVYETDKEVADAIRTMPHDSESVRRYRSYAFAVKSE